MNANRSAAGAALPRARSPRARLGTLCLLGAALCPAVAFGQVERPMRILLTNDDGIAELEARVYPLAQQLRPFADVYIVVANQDRSGSTHVMSLNRRVTLESQLVYVAEAEEGLQRVEIHTVDGYPADCVVLGIRGIMAGDPPDLVISGPNGGGNLADAWFGSGTIGAARTAAYLGVPALAVSGVNDRSAEQVDALARWVAALARSDVVASLPDLTYLTVGLPRLPPSEIAGVRIARRAHLADTWRLDRLSEIRAGDEDDEVTSVWAVRSAEPAPAPPPDSDVVLYEQNYIVITPMRADEHDAQLFDQLQAALDRLPEWPPR